MKRLRAWDRRILRWFRAGGGSRRFEVGPFAVLRAVPQVGFLLIALVLLGDLAYAGHHLAGERAPILVDQDGHRITSTPTSPAPDDDPAVVAAPTGAIDPQIGPDPAQDLKTYFSQRHKALRALVAAQERAPVAAVISFTHPVAPADLAKASYGTQITAVLVHVPIAGRTTGAGAVTLGPGPLAQSVAAAVKPAIQPLLDDARNNQSQGDTTVVVTSADAAQKADYYAEATANTAEAAAYRDGGAYIYAVVTAGSPSLLLGLASHAGIRLVDPGPVGLPVDKVVPEGIFCEDTTTVSEVVPLEGIGR